MKLDFRSKASSFLKLSMYVKNALQPSLPLTLITLHRLQLEKAPKLYITLQVIEQTFLRHNTSTFIRNV